MTTKNKQRQQQEQKQQQEERQPVRLKEDEQTAGGMRVEVG
jgi:hypothetical protein